MAMEGLDELEEYLRTARILDVVSPGNIGGAHEKRLLILEGGVGVIAKPADVSPEAPQMVRREAAAWVLARLLGWSDLVAATVIREIPSFSSGGDVEASLMVAWPNNQPDQDPGFDDHDVWRAAVFDAAIRQSDRAGHNWLCVPESGGQGTAKLKLIDHGYAFFFPGRDQIGSTFVEAKRGQPIPDAVLEGVNEALEQWPGQLDVLFEDEDEVPKKVEERLRHFAERGQLDA
jgi:hypothetical protein